MCYVSVLCGHVILWDSHVLCVSSVGSCDSVG